MSTKNRFFLIAYNLENFGYESIFSIKKLILEMSNVDILILDFVQICPSKSLLLVVLRDLRNEPHIQ